MKAVIVGGGISGLSAAYYLKDICRSRNIVPDLEILEAGNKLGGVISTNYERGFIIDEGPDSFITNKPIIIELLSKLGLENQLIFTNDKNRRAYVYLNKKLYPLPEGFLMFAPANLNTFFKSQLFSFNCKLRTLADFLLPKSTEKDESVYSFVTRRFGKEIYYKAAQPMIGGIYTGDAKKLSMKATMPQLYNLEKKYRSVLSGIRKSDIFSKGEQSGARYVLFASLKNGMQVLVDKLERELGPDSIKLNHFVDEISKTKDGWRTLTAGREVFSDVLIISTPSYIASNLTRGFDEGLSTALSKIEYASSMVVSLVYRKKDFSPSGFGVVIPETERKNIIACSFTSEKFPNRAPGEFIILRCFLGGILNAEPLKWDEETTLKKVLEELGEILNIKNKPEFYVIRKYERSMPQYNLGHSDIVEQTNNLSSVHRGFSLAGNAYNGVGIPDCILSGKLAAEKVINDIYFS